VRTALNATRSRGNVMAPILPDQGAIRGDAMLRRAGAQNGGGNDPDGTMARQIDDATFANHT